MNVARTVTVVAVRLQLNWRGPRTSLRSYRFYASRAAAPTTMTAKEMQRRDYGGSSPRHTKSLDNRAVSEAQNIVGCHTGLGRLTSDKVTDVTSHPHWMADSDHLQVLETAKWVVLYISHTQRESDLNAVIVKIPERPQFILNGVKSQYRPSMLSNIR